ncbi:MAG: hypothetical protein DMD40_14600 [Gemmatimonadetes bacterium]|nr:MAG: hypothetical protein DMD40_14600 [Gemmatimonadota bacterium]
MRSTAIVLLGIAWGIPPGLTAQAQLEFAPYVGSYRPTSIIGIGDGSFPNPNTPPQGVRDTVRQLNSAARGIRVTKWGPGRLGFEATVGYAPSSLWSSLAYTARVYDAHVLTMSLKALQRVTPPQARAALYVGGGVVLVDHGGEAWNSDASYHGPKMFVGGIANAGAAVKPVGWLRVRFDAEDFVYFAHLGPCTRSGPGSGGVCDVFGEWAARTTGARLQNELVLSVGLALVLHVAERHGSESHQ